MLGRVADADPITDTERAVYGPITPVDLHAFLSRWTSDELGSPIADVRFRAGRIDVVWGVELVDGRSAVIKTHRPPVDLEALRTAVAAQRLLADRGFPCAEPIAGELGRRSGVPPRPISARRRRAQLTAFDAALFLRDADDAARAIARNDVPPPEPRAGSSRSTHAGRSA